MEKTRILTGDFNSPKLELDTGEIITWGQKIDASGKPRLSVNPKWKHQCTGERWDSAERNIIENHKTLGLQDAFRIKNTLVRGGVRGGEGSPIARGTGVGGICWRSRASTPSRTGWETGSATRWYSWAARSALFLC